MALTGNTVTLPGVAVCKVPCGKHPAEQHTAEEIAEPTEAPDMLPRTLSPDGARVFFITPADGDIVSNAVGIDFVIEAMSATKAGDNQPNPGHHHSLSDADLPDLGRPIPASANLCACW